MLHDIIHLQNILISNQEKRLDLANVTGIYDRDFKNWTYLCRKCHLKFDNVYIRMWITRKQLDFDSYRSPSL